MIDLPPLLAQLAATLAGEPDIDVGVLERRLGLDVSAAAITKTRRGDFIVSGVRMAPVEGLVDILVAVPPLRSIVICPQTDGAAGKFTALDLPGARTIYSPTGRGFVCVAPVGDFWVGVSASLPERIIQTIYAETSAPPAQ